MTSFPPTTIDLIRHGEPEGGVKFRGHTDDPLSATGWAQMRAALAAAAPWQAVVASPLRRCAEFAAEMAERAGAPLDVDERFKEIGFGAWEGLTPDEVMQTDADAVDRFWRDPGNHPPPGGERFDAFAARVAAAWADLLAKYAGRHVLLVAHGGVNRVILCHALHIPLSHMFRLDVPFAARSRLQVTGQGADALPRLVFHGTPMP